MMPGFPLFPPSARPASYMRSSVLLLASTLALAACTSSDKSRPASTTATGGTLIITTLGDAQDVLPPYVNDIYGRMVQDQVFDRLAEIDSTLNTRGDKTFTPRLAQKWTWAPDSLSITFSLDPRARWHDGQPVTAADVRYSFRTFMDPKVGSSVAPTMSNIDSVSVRDSLTAVVWFKKRTPEQFYDVAYQLVVFPEHVYGKIPVDQLHNSPAARAPIGSGRFRLTKWNAGTRIELVSDTANYRGRAKVDRVVIVPTDPATGAAQILSGQADFMEAFPIDQVAKLDSNKFARSIQMPQLGYLFLAMNPRARKSKSAPNPIFSDLRVRRALSMAVDRELLLQNVFGKTGRISHGPFAMTVAYADSAVHPPPFDTTAAKVMLDSSGWRTGANGMRMKNGKPLRFGLITNPSLFRRRYAVLLQDQFRKIGAQVDVEQLDNAATFAAINGGDFDTILWGYAPDPSATGVKQMWSTAGIGPTGQNQLEYSNPKVDALLDSASTAFDQAKAKGYTSKAFQTILNDAPAIWLYDLLFTYAVNRRIDVTGMRSDEWWAGLADWSIPPDKRIDRDRIGLTPPKP
jgi:peptide/nickel transport system substrate-binding protein